MVRHHKYHGICTLKQPEVLLNAEDVFTNLASWASLLTKTVKNAEESLVKTDNDAFKIQLVVKHFKADDLTIRVVEDSRTIQVEAQYQDREAEHGSVSRFLMRKYVVPEVYDLTKIHSKLTPRGVLQIHVPVIGENRTEDVEIPIIRE